MLRRINGFFKWNDALEACKEIDAHIFEPREKPESEDDLAFLSYDGFGGSEDTFIWTGINDRAKNGEFVYESTGEKVTFDIFILIKIRDFSRKSEFPWNNRNPLARYNSNFKKV